MSRYKKEPAEGHHTIRDTADGIVARNADDVEGHGILRREPDDSHTVKRGAEGHQVPKGPADGILRRDEDDVQGHSMLVDPGMARDLARARDKDVQKRAERHGLEEEARRPHNPKR